MSASDCGISVAHRGTRPRGSESGAGAYVGAAARSGIRVDLACAGGVALGLAALRVGRLGADVGLALEALGLGLELLGAGAAAVRPRPAGTGPDAAPTARPLALAAPPPGERHAAAGHHGDEG